MRRQFGVRVQVGGSDQWGNILAGTDLMRRMMGGPEEAEEAAGSTNGSISSSGGSISISAVAAADDSAGAPPSSSSSEGFVSEQCFGLTFPLLLKADGSKFGCVLCRAALRCTVLCSYVTGVPHAGQGS